MESQMARDGRGESSVDRTIVRSVKGEKRLVIEEWSEQEEEERKTKCMSICCSHKDFTVWNTVHSYNIQ